MSPAAGCDSGRTTAGADYRVLFVDVLVISRTIITTLLPKVQSNLYGNASLPVIAPLSQQSPHTTLAFLPWLQAARPAAYPMIFMPLFIGQALAFNAHGQFSSVQFAFACVFGAMYQMYLLYQNDHADADIDLTNEQFWLSGGSRVIAQGKLNAADLLRGTRVALGLIGLLAIVLAVLFDRPWFSAGAALAVAVSWAYNRRPLQLSYRGHGETMQGLGCGVVLPSTGFYLQSGSLQGLPWISLAILFVMFYAGNILTALPDYRSDLQGGKRTWPVRYGERHARISVLVLLVLAYSGIILAMPSFSPLQVAIILVPANLIFVAIVVSGVLRHASVTQFAMCKRFVNAVSISQAWVLGAWSALLFISGAQ